jgi:glycyl-tRNA synthetase beta chain
MGKRDFLVEIGSEELPPKSLFTLAAAFGEGIVRELTAASVPHGAMQWFATPRRMAVRVNAVADRQPDQSISRLGPSVVHAFDAGGQPTKAALGFATSCGTTVESLQQVEGPKGKVLQFLGTKPGATTISLLPEIVSASLRSLPIARRMRWGASDEEFVRPVHWVLMLFGSEKVDARILGIGSDKSTRGHRFHAPREIPIRSPNAYVSALLERGYVIADVGERRERIRTRVTELALALGGNAVIEDALLDEVTALVEWPVPIAGRFDAQYLQLPAEVPIATMQDHQRYFPMRDSSGRLTNQFITVANIDSRDPDKVRDGNERVVRPRLADAAFFWKLDREQRLEARREALKAVTFQSQLGSLFDRTERISALVVLIAEQTGADVEFARRAAELCKSDLLTSMVGEFPELQGTMGKYYAEHDGEMPEVCLAIEEQYLPKFAGDRLPSSGTGRALALAEKLDLIAGIFAIGQKPTGTRDPFGLRRAALGVLRICAEAKLDLDLRSLIEASVRAQPVDAASGIVDEVWAYIVERMRGSYLESDASITTEMFDAVIASRTTSPVDIDARLRALKAFMEHPASASLASANKRIANILRKSAAGHNSTRVDPAKLIESAERQLYDRLREIEPSARASFGSGNYEHALAQLAALKDDVDGFFDSVMVMAEDEALRTNRLALLANIRELFLCGVDLSKLPG